VGFVVDKLALGQVFADPVAVRSKAWVFGRSLARIVGSNSTGGMDVCVRYMDDSMKHKVTCRTKRTSTVQMDQRGKPRN
jgi:hypothetical protein